MFKKILFSKTNFCIKKILYVKKKFDVRKEWFKNKLSIVIL